MPTIYARLINEFKYKSDINFSASVYKNNEEDQKIDEDELHLNFNNK